MESSTFSFFSLLKKSQNIRHEHIQIIFVEIFE